MNDLFSYPQPDTCLLWYVVICTHEYHTSLADTVSGVDNKARYCFQYNKSKMFKKKIQKLFVSANLRLQEGKYAKLLGLLLDDGLKWKFIKKTVFQYVPVGND